MVNWYVARSGREGILGENLGRGLLWLMGKWTSVRKIAKTIGSSWFHGDGSGDQPIWGLDGRARAYGGTWAHKERIPGVPRRVLISPGGCTQPGVPGVKALSAGLLGIAWPQLQNTLQGPGST